MKTILIITPLILSLTSCSMFPDAIPSAKGLFGDTKTASSSTANTGTVALRDLDVGISGTDQSESYSDSNIDRTNSSSKTAHNLGDNKLIVGSDRSSNHNSVASDDSQNRVFGDTESLTIHEGITIIDRVVNTIDRIISTILQNITSLIFAFVMLYVYRRARKVGFKEGIASQRTIYRDE